MSAEDGSADELFEAGNGDVPAPAEGVGGAHLVSLGGRAALQPGWLRPAIAFVVVCAHGLALIALSGLHPQAPPAEETIEVNVIAAGDEAPVTTAPVQAASQSASEAAPEAKPEQNEAPDEATQEPVAPASAAPDDTATVVEKEAPAQAPETTPALDAPPPTTPAPEASAASPPPPETTAFPQPAPSVETQMQPLPPPPDAPPSAATAPERVSDPPPSPDPPQPSTSVEAQMQALPPPPDAPPPAPTAEEPLSQPPPPPQSSISVEAQIQPLPPPPDAPPVVAAEEVEAPPATPADTQSQPPSAPQARPNQAQTPLQHLPKPQARLEPVERQKPQASPDTAERPKSRKPAEAKPSAGAKEASLGATGSAEAHRVGEANGRAVVGMSRSDYAALLVAQIQAHKFYPDSARARGEQGAVGVSFTVGPSGRVGSAAVVRSSGFAELDNAAREILHSIAPPPPPGGSFSASTTIRFHFE